MGYPTGFNYKFGWGKEFTDLNYALWQAILNVNLKFPDKDGILTSMRENEREDVTKRMKGYVFDTHEFNSFFRFVKYNNQDVLLVLEQIIQNTGVTSNFFNGGY